MNKKSFWTGYGIGVVIIIIGAFIFKANMEIPNTPLDNLELHDLSGKQVKAAELLDKPLIVNYWATWCAPCIEEFPIFEKVKVKAASKVNIVMISDEKSSTIEAFNKKNKYTFTYLLAGKAISFPQRPVTAVYNKKGELVSQIMGTVTEKQLLDLIDNAGKE
ncbi:TlpA family protein disulfide reductase [Chryseobacterium polytrichastri]|uniref:Thiol-disulfide isomerase or thioredoxin n=1 Tax=Chryseobacterium polytrichastri TaxID=1302687 RepID=A0A1M7HDT9_9FLAO|nr:TlpA disulfide reductase family protein [Chryseobacterium polytrichastri]SHM26347.1 Thiol-disulfide isomerase or thioredoxin [Chryseobacterium polytrichastri]